MRRARAAHQCLHPAALELRDAELVRNVGVGAHRRVAGTDERRLDHRVREHADHVGVRRQVGERAVLSDAVGNRAATTCVTSSSRALK